MATTLVSPNPTVDVGTGSPGDSSDLDLTGALGEGFDQAAAESPGGEAGSELTPPSELPIEAPSGEQPTQPQEAAPAVEGEQFPLSPDGSSYMVPKAALPEFQAAQQYRQQVGEFFPDVQAAQVANEQAFSFRHLFNDWTLGTPESIANVLNHWSGGNETSPHMRAAYQNSFAQMAYQLPQVLAQVNPQVHQQLVQHLGGQFLQSLSSWDQVAPVMHDRMIEALYQRAAQTQDPKVFKAAQHLNYIKDGTYKTELSQVQLPKGPDPQALQQQQFEAQRKQFEQTQTAALHRDAQGFDSSALVGARNRELATLIDKNLEPLKTRYSEATIADMKRGVYQDILGKLQSQADWWLEHEQSYGIIMKQFEQTWRQGAPGRGLQPLANSFVQNFLSKAKGLLPSAVKARQAVAPLKPGPKPQAAGQARAQGASPAPNGANGRSLTPSQEADRELAQFFDGFRAQMR